MHSLNLDDARRKATHYEGLADAIMLDLEDGTIYEGRPDAEAEARARMVEYRYLAQKYFTEAQQLTPQRRRK